MSYLFTILTPQNIWFWAFLNIRPSYTILIATIAGFFFKIATGTVEYSYVKTKLGVALLILWIAITISYLFGPYVDVVNQYRFTNAKFSYHNLSTIFAVAAMSLLLITDKNKFNKFVLLMPITAVTMTYWANMQYISGHAYGRLHGPTGMGTSIYNDENAFAMLLVVTLPFLYSLGLSCKLRLFKYSVWAFIPFGWHAIFLTGSRGGLLALAGSIIIMTIKTPSKYIKLTIIPLFIVAFIWQGGQVIKERADTMSSYQQDSSARTRIEAWGAAINMAKNLPFTGVGIGSFGQAFPTFSDKAPRIAHNTFFQLLGECGLLGGATYLFLIFYSFNSLRMYSNLKRNHGMHKKNQYMYHTSIACMASIVGFFICSLFLSLERFDIFYFLIITSNFIITEAKNLATTTAKPNR